MIIDRTDVISVVSPSGDLIRCRHCGSNQFHIDQKQIFNICGKADNCLSCVDCEATHDKPLEDCHDYV